ncbi:MAG TPA: class A beta-lactamase-related serine hydrolase [Caldithrix abyssi]|uniref:Class A beta-lactamase-related serine hydrolase n=1 Tax=Caldithrix abyssi TaxID=187145 RepID=A0A7V4TYV6_CALAY|nr:class A beta-lactamase-related serine hydrolase [Caldithrix abyssi]
MFYRALLFLTIILLFSCQSKEEKVDRLFAPYQGSQKPGAALMVIHNGQPELVKTYGMADIEHGVSVTPQTSFRLASVTKQFTAMCIMMLTEQGRLSYDTRLTDVFPDFPAYGNTITIRNILQHTSGLIAYEDLIPDTATVQVLDRDVLQMMKEQDSTYFEPGTVYRYSNTGYAVLAMVVEKISGQSFPDFLKENIFRPLHMDNTVAFVKGVNTVPHRAFGYTVHADDSVEFTDQSITSAVLGDGGIYSSLEDLFKWDQALYTDKLVSKKTLQLAFAPNLENYGFGWRIDTYKGHRRVHHTGSTRGFRNVIQRFPDDRFTVIILTNRNDPGVAPLAEKITDLFLIKK